MLDTTPVTAAITKQRHARGDRQRRVTCVAWLISERLILSAEPDGFGFHYGWAQRSGEWVRVDVLPPEHLWHGDTKLGRPEARPQGVVYLDGEEFARVKRR